MRESVGANNHSAGFSAVEAQATRLDQITRPRRNVWPFLTLTWPCLTVFYQGYRQTVTLHTASEFGIGCETNRGADTAKNDMVPTTARE